MSKPFAVALAGLVLFITILALGELSHSKGAFPLAFLLGGTMMLGGMAVGVVRSLTGGPRRS
jgi:hypothetical protein